MEIFTMLLFFIMALGFGHTITFFIKWDVPFYERFFMLIGLGLGTIPVVGILLNHLRVQIYWPIFLVLSLLVPAYSVYVGRKNIQKALAGLLDIKLRIKKSGFYFILVLMMSLVFFGVYHHGAFKYPYLEDDDPWLHAQGVKYIKEFRTISFNPAQIEVIGQHYLEPYPPGYDMLMGILHQTNENVIWTLKFFNVLILSLLGIFFYFFAVTFLGSSKKAALATFFLLIIPCFMSHFIWASSLAVMLFFPAFYTVERADKDWRWILPGVIVMAGMICTQMSNPFIFGILLAVYLVIKSIAMKRVLWKVLLAGFLGAVIAFSIFWIPAIAKFGLDTTAGANSIKLDDLESITTKASGGGLIYSWEDLIVAKKQSKMDNPIGLGVFLFFLLLFSLFLIVYFGVRNPKNLLSPDGVWKVVSIVWLIIAFIGIHGNRMPFPVLMPHRWWAIFAIPVAIICAEGFFDMGRILSRLKIPRFVPYFVIIAGILLTSAYPKYVVETSYWPPGSSFGSMDELQGYFSYVVPLPYNTKVFPLCAPERNVLAFDKYAEPWDPDYVSFKKSAFDIDIPNLNSGLRARGYEYLLIGYSCLKTHDTNSTNLKINELNARPDLFTVSGSHNGLVIFRVL